MTKKNKMIAKEIKKNKQGALITFVNKQAIDDDGKIYLEPHYKCFAILDESTIRFENGMIRSIGYHAGKRSIVDKGFPLNLISSIEYYDIDEVEDDEDDEDDEDKNKE